MISFIVIGLNEEKYLLNCFRSIFETIKVNNILKYEILYVDSNSSDKSIEIAKGFKEIKIFKLSHVCNAAIARNLGADLSNGETLFFIDGDLEINPSFLQKALDSNCFFKYDVAIGKSIHYYYDYSGNLLNKKEEEPHHGNFANLNIKGWFIIKRSIWYRIGGMKTKLRSSQDRDFFLELMKKKIKIEFINDIIAIHHTISYLNNKRMWTRLFNGTELYGRSVFYRCHIFNKNIWSILFRYEYTMLSLIILLIAGILSQLYLLFLIYPLMVLTRIFFQQNKTLIDVFNRIPYYLLRDVLTILGGLFFYPQEKKNIQYEIIQ